MIKPDAQIAVLHWPDGLATHYHASKDSVGKKSPNALEGDGA
jgi:hypothetical protein